MKLITNNNHKLELTRTSLYAQKTEIALVKV